MLQNFACDDTPSSQKTLLVQCYKLILVFLESQILIPWLHPYETYSASVKNRNDLDDIVARHVGYSLIVIVKVKETVNANDSSLKLKISTLKGNIKESVNILNKEPRSWLLSRLITQRITVVYV